MSSGKARVIATRQDRVGSAAAAPHQRPPLREGEIVLVVSIDTEEDNWVPARAGVTVENIASLPESHRRLTARGVRPTYFTSHAVVADPRSAAVLREIHSGGVSEMGAHLHPWNTPPLEEAFVPRNTMVGRLPAALQLQKLERLTGRMKALFGVRPYAFRAGRWGIGPGTVGVLAASGYRVDSSVTPYTTWAAHDDGPSHERASNRPYRIDADADLYSPSPRGGLVELPPSFGFSRGPFHRVARMHRALSRGPARALLLNRVASRVGVARHVSLSPETDTVADMLALSRGVLAETGRYLHMYWHSPSLRPGLTPFVRTRGDVARFHDTIERYLDRIGALGTIRFATVSEAAALLRADVAGAPDPR